MFRRFFARFSRPTSFWGRLDIYEVHVLIDPGWGYVWDHLDNYRITKEEK